MNPLDSLPRPPTKYGPGRPVRNFCELGRLRAEIDGDEIAYTFLVDGENEEAHLRFGEIDHQARALGAKLQTLGEKGDRTRVLVAEIVKSYPFQYRRDEPVGRAKP